MRPIMQAHVAHNTGPVGYNATVWCVNSAWYARVWRTRDKDYNGADVRHNAVPVARGV